MKKRSAQPISPLLTAGFAVFVLSCALYGWRIWVLPKFQKNVQPQSDMYPVLLSANSEFRPAVLDAINAKRQEKMLAPLQINKNICLAASSLAEESERTYNPKTQRNSQNEYKKYLSAHPNNFFLKSTANDLIVSVLNRNQERMGASTEAETIKDGFISNETLEESFINENSLPVILNGKLQYGCVAVSSGAVGFKPFAYFVGAE